MIIDKPFTDTEMQYTVLPNDDGFKLDIVNLKSGGRYTVDLFNRICTCKDFKNRSKGGTCKHIEYLCNHEKIKPFLPQENNVDVSSIATIHEGGMNGESLRSTSPSTSQSWDSPFSIMERKDEDQILIELKGNVIQEFVYSFKQGTREITGLSYAGTKQIALEMGNIHCCEPLITEMNGNWVCKVKVRDTYRNMEMWGVSCQPKQMKTQWGPKDDDFALQKAVSKAERNALRKLMPEKLIVEMIKEWQLKNLKNPNNRGQQ
jgi:hypothetical protein